MTNTFEKIIYGFLQAGITGQDRPNVTPDFDTAVEMLATNKTLRVQSFLAWPIGAQAGLSAMLKDWLIVFQLAEAGGDALPIPSSWLDGSSSTRLNEQIVAEILQRSDDLQSLYQRRMPGGQDRGPAH